MATIEFSLFRVKFIKPRQGVLFDRDITPEEVMNNAINQRPSFELRSGHSWHIGNNESFGTSRGYFAFGRTTHSTIEKFDDITGNFIEEETEESPNTHCVYDSSIGFIGIAKKQSLSQSTKGIASRLQQLLSKTDVVSMHNISVEILPIPDPSEFLIALEKAYRVFRFTATFRGPNPFDADEFFQKPMAIYLKESGGEKGKTTIQGEDLDRNVLTEVTKSTAATGNEASARIQDLQHQKSRTINLKGDPIRQWYDTELISYENILQNLTLQYIKVRKNVRNED